MWRFCSSSILGSIVWVVIACPFVASSGFQPRCLLRRERLQGTTGNDAMTDASRMDPVPEQELVRLRAERLDVRARRDARHLNLGQPESRWCPHHLIGQGEDIEPENLQTEGVL